MKVLVTGGAGYIGSFLTSRLVNDGHEVVIVDSLEKGYQDALPESAAFEQGNLSDKVFLTALFKKYTFDMVFHFAAYISVAESVRQPGKYYENNIGSTVHLLEAMVEHGVKRIIFSSTAAVYGTPTTVPIPEDHSKHPESPYGHSKLVVEEILSWYQQVYGVRFVVLRYFNASGGALDGNQGERHTPETHMIPSAISCILENKHFTLFGNDYDTPDGTCIRDYIHVIDLAEAHVLAWKKIQAEIGGGYFYNIGTGKGYSNKEVTDMVMKVSNKVLQITYGARRSGDPSVLVADASKIKRELGFEPKYSDLETIIRSAWLWHTKSNALTS